jgi:hypothetical protein
VCGSQVVSHRCVAYRRVVSYKMPLYAVVEFVAPPDDTPRVYPGACALCFRLGTSVPCPAPTYPIALAF